VKTKTNGSWKETRYDRQLEKRSGLESIGTLWVNLMGSQGAFWILYLQGKLQVENTRNTRLHFEISMKRLLTPMKKLTMFYDGRCPLCAAEILFLSRRNESSSNPTPGLLSFVDVNSAQFSADTVGVSCQQALDSMYARYDDGELINGVEVFSAAYARADLPTLAWLFSRPGLRPVLTWGYRFFAKNRHAISSLLGPTALRLVKATSSPNSPNK
jgi:predicted DCC family thiol-disulfide oxidoreductase YuxK